MMKDRYALVSRARKLSDVHEAISSSGYMNDETRRTLMAAVDRSPLPKKWRAEAFKAVMGPVGGMQSSSRCMDWWESLVKSEERTRVALDHGMPFASLLSDFEVQEVLRNALSDGHHSAALLLWTHGHTPAQRVAAIDDTVTLLSVFRLDNEEQWIAPTLSAIKARPDAEQMQLLAHYFSEGWFFEKRDRRLGQAWGRAFFPDGLSQERFDVFRVHIQNNARNIQEAALYAESLVVGLVSVHEQKVLSDSTPQPHKAAPARRI